MLKDQALSKAVDLPSRSTDRLRRPTGKQRGTDHWSGFSIQFNSIQFDSIQEYIYFHPLIKELRQLHVLLRKAKHNLPPAIQRNVSSKKKHSCPVGHGSGKHGLTTEIWKYRLNL